MSELSAFGPLVAVAVAVIAIFLVLGIFYVVQRQAEKSVRSPEYWNEEPDGRRYPTGWGDQPASAPPERGSPEGSAGTAEPEATDSRTTEPGSDSTAQNGATREGDEESPDR